MNLKEAVEKLKEGQWTSVGDWSEYSMQLTLTDGKAHWTAGMTVGGLVKNLDTFNNSSNDWEIYDNWKGQVITESEGSYLDTLKSMFPESHLLKDEEMKAIKLLQASEK